MRYRAHSVWWRHYNQCWLTGSIDIKLDMDIYPNPATDKLSIFYNLPEGSNTAQLQIINLNGEEILTQRITRGLRSTVELEVSDWAQGMYVCEITTAKSN